MNNAFDQPKSVLPGPVYQDIKAFLAAGKTGQIALVINQGNVQSYQITEHKKVVQAPLLDSG